MKTRALLFAFAVAFAGCAEDGDTGPQGPAGNANVKQFKYTINPGDWSTYGNAGQIGHGKYYEKSISDITQDIIDNGVVLTYYQESGAETLLPLELYGSTFDVLFQSLNTVGKCEIDVYQSNLGTPNITGVINFKTVIIDGTVRAMNPDLDWNDYEAVQRRFNLE